MTSSSPTQHHLAIDALLRQAPPFRFVDSASIDSDGSKIVGRRRFSPEELYFRGHFPGDPIVPGVILIEAMAQLCRLWLNHDLGHPAPGFLVRVHSATFNRTVRPDGDIQIEARRLGEPVFSGAPARERMVEFRCVVLDGNVRCARAHLTLQQFIHPADVDIGRLDGASRCVQDEPSIVAQGFNRRPVSIVPQPLFNQHCLERPL